MIENNKDLQKSLESIAQVGFAFSDMLKAVPADINEKFSEHFNHKTSLNSIRFISREASSIALAIAKGYTPEQRKEHKAKMKAERLEKQKAEAK